MTALISPQMYLSMARSLAKANGLFVIEKSDCFLLYRSTEAGNMRVGKRKDEKAMYNYVKKVTGK